MDSSTVAAKDGKRVFAHYVLGRLIFLFFLCHPGTLATCDGQAYLLNRYPNRDLVTTEGQLQDHRRHLTPRDPNDFAMKTGVPEDLIKGDADCWTPDWALSLEDRFQRKVEAWLRRPSRAKQQAETAAAKFLPPGLAFVPTVDVRGAMDAQAACVKVRQKDPWASLAELGVRPRAAPRPSARTRRSGGCGRCRYLRGSPGSTHQMILGLGKRRFPSRHSIFSAPDSTSAGSTRGGEDEDFASAKDVDARTVEKLEATSRSLEDPKPRRDASEGVLSSVLGGAADAYDSAMSFVGWALVTLPLGKRCLSAYDNLITVPASTIDHGSTDVSGDGVDMSGGGGGYNLVGISNIDPFEASGRRGRRTSSRLLVH